MSDWDSGDDTPLPVVSSSNYQNQQFNDNKTQYNRNRYDQRNDNRQDYRNGRGQRDRPNFNNGRREHNNFRYQNRDEIILEVYTNKVGMIIGRGGAKIKEIQANHNVNVKVDRDSKVYGMSTVIIRGSQSDTQNAKKTIEDLIADPIIEPVQEPPPKKEYIEVDWREAAKVCEEEMRKKWAQCPKMLKNFYKEDPTISRLSPTAVELFRESQNNITVSRAFKDKPLSDVPIPNPIMKFEQCFSEWPEILNEIESAGFQTPSPIQCQAWPILLKGEDMIGIAQTGTGKTLAFLLPALIHTEYQPIPRGPARGGPNVLILAPTRELALQIEKEVSKYHFKGIKACCVYGGGDRRSQMTTIQQGVEIVIATPGRLNDLVQADVIDVNSITYLVLDEADRMLDMGFEPQIRKVMLHIRPDRQTVMTSATWPLGVRRLAEKYMNNPIQVCIGSLDLAAVHSVTQIIEIMAEEEKFDRIMDFVQNMAGSEKVIIFCGKKSRADNLSSEISLNGIAVQCIHGDREQADREQALEDIKTGEVMILIATDVASRGIDIGDITHVINYDFPRNIEEYVHRVGRTGRAGKTGVSLSYFTRSDWSSAGELIDILEEASQRVPDELREMKKRFDSMKEKREREKSSYGGGGRGGRGFRQRYNDF